MTDRKVVLTGASSGIGNAVAELLRQDGDSIVALDVNAPGRNDVTFVECNLADPAAIDDAVAAIGDPIDVLINVAGVPGTVDPLLVMQVNFLGLRHLTDALANRVSAGGSIVNVASISGAAWQRHLGEIEQVLETPDFSSGSDWFRAHSRDGSGAYTLSKECVVAYTKRLAQAARARGFNCNAVSPGPVETPILPSFHEQEHPGQIDWVIEQTGRAADPFEIARVVRLLTTPDAQWINGQDVQVDGGFSAGLEVGWIDGAQSPARRARAARS